MARIRTTRRPAAAASQEQYKRWLGYGLIALLLIWVFGSALLLLVWKPPLQQHDTDVAALDPGHLLLQHSQHSKDIKQLLHLGQNKADSYLELYESPLLIFTCARAEYLEKTLAEIYKYLPKQCHIGCPIVVSQDGNDASVSKIISTFQAKFAKDNIPLIHLQHLNTEQVNSQLLRGSKPWQVAYKKLAIHYGWALSQVFSTEAYAIPKSSLFDDEWPVPQRVLILEEDILIAPDFFDYFAKTAEILDTDSTLFSISAFNDNGYSGKIQNHTRVLRSDFFPGLGWMMSRKLWVDELESKWPGQYWDDWLREKDQRQSRQVLRPEISRTFHFGFKGGASLNQYGNLLDDIQLNTVPVDWKNMDLSYLDSSVFDKDYLELVKNAMLVNSLDQAVDAAKDRNVRIEYHGKKEFQKMAKQLQLMADEKAGVPRTAYKGIVETRPHSQHFLFLTPPMQQLQEAFETQQEIILQA